MISAITNQGQLNFMVFRDNFNANVFLKFLKRLVKHSRSKVFLIVGNHRSHRAKNLQKWLKKNEEHIRLFFLPGYSPDLNPDELLNQDIKSNAVGRKRQPHKVRQYFLKENVRYAQLNRKLFYAPRNNSRQIVDLWTYWTITTRGCINSGKYRRGPATQT